ncbi:MAG: hypothetical protein IJJ01_03905 [Firmicutes bacterium]|nr:hypothetical protein [Bacillota bacterium]
MGNQYKEKQDNFIIGRKEIVALDLELKATLNNGISTENNPQLATLDSELERVNMELNRYTSHADKVDYALAVASGIIAGIVDAVYVSELHIEEAHEWGSEKTEDFIVKVARWQGYKGYDVKGAIKYLADEKVHNHSDMKKGFHLASDPNMMEFGGPLQHHMRDFSHHASITGLAFSVLTQFTGKCFGTNTTGEFIIRDVKNKELIGKDVPQKLLFGVVYWFFHMVSDIAGSGSLSEGTGVPGPLLSIAKTLSSTPLFKNNLNEKGHRELSVFLSKLFNGTLLGKRDEFGKLHPLKVDLRTEVGIGHHLQKQAFPVLVNEIIVRALFFIRRLSWEIMKQEINSFSDIKAINWENVKPSGNRTIDRMLTVSTMTFSLADTTDAAVHAAIESGGNWVLFAGRFVTRFNYVGAGRATVAIVKEFSNERKEEQLIHEKRLLTEAKTEIVLEQLQEYKQQLEERVSEYLAEDISAFLEGFDYINEGIMTGDSDIVIHGNVVIQRVLGREPQFTNQREFDELMDSNDALIL